MWSDKLFRTIELNITELCNFKCAFCPRAFDYPNQNYHMTLETVDRVIECLRETPQINKIALAGRGEPTLHKEFVKLSQKLIDFRNTERPDLIVWIATNGKRVDKYADILKQFTEVRYSLYDESTLTEKEVFEKYGHWKNFVFYNRTTEGLKSAKPETYHNRAGSVVHPIAETKTLFHPTYGLICEKPLNVVYIDWQGNYNLCCNDWEDIKVFGNIYDESIHEFLTSNQMLKEYQDNLLAGKRDLDPCSSCNRPVHPNWMHYFANYVDQHQ